jgi:hypothetical protein
MVTIRFKEKGTKGRYSKGILTRGEVLKSTITHNHIIRVENTDLPN